MKTKWFSFIPVLFLLSSAGCANQSFSFFKEKPESYKITKVNSQKKYLHMMTRTRGVLGTTNWGKFNYDVVQLPYEKQGEYFSVNWKRTGGPKILDKDLILRIDYKHVDGKVDFVEKVYSNSKRGHHQFVFENTGDRFVDNGQIELWKISMIVNGQVVSEKESQLWWTVANTGS